MTDLLISTLTQGLIYALISFGVYITYSILDFPDLGVDGTFPLGAAVTAVLLTRGVDPWLTLVAAVAVGALAGLFTGVVHVCLRVRNHHRSRRSSRPPTRRSAQAGPSR